MDGDARKARRQPALKYTVIPKILLPSPCERVSVCLSGARAWSPGAAVARARRRGVCRAVCVARAAAPPGAHEDRRTPDGGLRRAPHLHLRLACPAAQPSASMGPDSYAFALCLGVNRKSAGTGPRSISVILTQSLLLGEAISVSRSLRPTKGGGRSCRRPGSRSRSPTGT